MKEPAETLSPTFAADCMLGTLAKWLRILGYDAFYRRRIEDGELVELARAEGRVLLTRDRRLTERRRARPFVLIVSERPAEQIHQMIAEIGLELREERLLTRCLPCNAPTEEIAPEEAYGTVPTYVFETQSRFRRCRSCRRIYWGATHKDRILETIRGLFPADPRTFPDGAPRQDSAIIGARDPE